MTKYVVAACIDERGRAHGGADGDQTGRELYVHTLASSGNWVYILRPPSNAEIMVKQAYAAAANNNIGYDQYERTTLYTKAKNNNWDLSKIKSKCECDCSSLIAVLCNCAGFKVSKDIWTGNQISALKAKGFKVWKYKASRLKPGDVLWCSYHTAIYVGTSKTYKSPTVKNSKPNASYPSMNKSYAQIQWNLTSCSNRRKNKSVKYIVIHNTGTNASAKNNCKYFSSGNRNASADFFIDKNGTIYKFNGSLAYRYSWHCGDGNGKHGITNYNSIGIEVVSAGAVFTDAQKKSLNKLVRAIMNDFGIPASKVVRHYDASRKLCPKAYCGSTAKTKRWKTLRDYITTKPKNTSSTVTNNNVVAVSSTAASSVINKTTTPDTSSGTKVESSNAENNMIEVNAASNRVAYARYLDFNYKGTYIVDSETGLNMKYNAGINNKRITCVSNGEKVTCYGYYSKSGDVKWLLVEYVKDNVTYTGYMNISYLKKT